MNKNIKKVNRKVLLHSLPFAVWLAMCFTVQAQAVDHKGASKSDLVEQEKAVKTQYLQALKACDSKLAPAECKRQAGLDFKQAKHALKLKRDTVNAQTKRDKHAKSQSDKANNVSTAKQGNGADGKPLERAPLTKRTTHQKKPSRALSKPLAPNTPAPKERLSKQGKPPKGVHSGGSLSPQPTPEERRNNVTKFAANEQATAARKAKIEQKKAKRLAKDNARRAAGYTVDKP